MVFGDPTRSTRTNTAPLPTHFTVSHLRHPSQVRGEEAVCTCNNSCVLEGLALTVHIAHMRNEAPILADTDVAAITQVGWGGTGACRGLWPLQGRLGAGQKGRRGGVT